MKSWLVLVTFLSVAFANEKIVGSLSQKAHGVSGMVYSKGEDTIIIKNFHYDGKGPDAYVFVGTQGEIQQANSIGIKVAHPVGSDSVLTGYSGSTLTVTLPSNVKVSQLKWLSIWCRAYSVNFGGVYFQGGQEDVQQSPQSQDHGEPGKPEPDYNSKAPPKVQMELLTTILSVLVVISMLH